MRLLDIILTKQCQLSITEDITVSWNHSQHISQDTNFFFFILLLLIFILCIRGPLHPCHIYVSFYSEIMILCLNVCSVYQASDFTFSLIPQINKGWPGEELKLLDLRSVKNHQSSLPKWRKKRRGPVTSPGILLYGYIMRVHMQPNNPD